MLRPRGQATGKSFVVDDKFSLGDLMALGLHGYVDACTEIVDRAQKELIVEKVGGRRRGSRRAGGQGGICTCACLRRRPEQVAVVHGRALGEAESAAPAP